MSAWRIGAGGGSAIGTLAGNSDGSSGGLTGFVDKVAKWIPGEVVTLYLAAITFVSEPGINGHPSVSLWLAAAVVTAVLVLIAGRKAQRTWPDVGKRVALGTVAFFIWSAVIPSSGWGGVWAWSAQNPKVMVVGAALAGLIFSALADAAVDGD